MREERAAAAEPHRVEAPAIFVSDVHLRHGDAPWLRGFLEFLDFVEQQRAGLFILGDLFEFWSGPAQARVPFYAPLFEALRRLSAPGRPVHMIHGNRDFLMGRAFRRAGVRFIREEALLDLAGERVHVSHGDRFCVDDRSYQWARVAMRSLPVRLAAALAPASVGIFLARRYRRISGKKTARMRAHGEHRLGSILRGVRGELARGRSDTILCGHVHHLAETRIDGPFGEGRLLTLGAWEDRPNYALFDGKSLSLRYFGETSGRADPAGPMAPGTCGDAGSE